MRISSPSLQRAHVEPLPLPRQEEVDVRLVNGEGRVRAVRRKAGQLIGREVGPRRVAGVGQDQEVGGACRIEAEDVLHIEDRKSVV